MNITILCPVTDLRNIIWFYYNHMIDADTFNRRLQINYNINRTIRGTYPEEENSENISWTSFHVFIQVDRQVLLFLFEILYFDLEAEVRRAHFLDFMWSQETHDIFN